MQDLRDSLRRQRGLRQARASGCRVARNGCGFSHGFFHEVWIVHEFLMLIYFWVIFPKSTKSA
jgi:hypothetical protein